MNDCFVQQHCQLKPLRHLFLEAKDNRDPRGMLYPANFILNCVILAVMSGAQGFKQISDWIEAQSFETLKKLGNTYHRKPHESTIRKLIPKLDFPELKKLCYDWSQKKLQEKSMETQGIALDGKILRGSRNEDNRQPHILSCITHGTGVLLGDFQIPNKSSEVQYTSHLLKDVDIKEKIITADALHTIKTFGQALVEQGAHYVFIAKGNKQKLISRLAALQIEKNHTSYGMTEEKGHGRLEKREVFLMGDLPFWLCFKSCDQAFIIKRYRKDIKSGKETVTTFFGLTSMSPEKADAELILKAVREHWSIENKGFYVRDVAFGEDRSTIRTKTLPQFFVLMRNLCINCFRFLGKINITQSIRKCSYNRDYAFRIFNSL